MAFRFQNHRMVCLSLLTIAILGTIGSRQNSRLAAQTVDYDRQVKPILSDRCFHCHGPDSEARAADLRLDILDDAEHVLSPGEPDDSELIGRIESNDPDEQMPPPSSKLSLTKSEIAILRQWIKEGAAWEQHWSFVPPTPPTIPQIAKAAAANNPIDHFILSKLESEKRKLAPRASSEKLLRRVTFDLTGLPPTLDEIDAFLADESDDAYEKVVDRLLASPRYGERMTSDWLDVARYSDSYGYQVDRDRFVWPWRDWVIRAFNANMPFSQFATEQLAGDLLPGATDDQILATTFNRLHPQKVEGGSVEEEFRVEYVADRAQTFGMAFLGLTVECCRCHDHKFDPLSQVEYYQLFSFFNNIDESGLYSYFDGGAVPTPNLLLMNEAQKNQLAELKSAVAAAVAETDSIYKNNLAVDGKQECHSEGALFSKKKGDRRISPLSPQANLEGRIGTLPEARLFTALRSVQNNNILDEPERLQNIFTAKAANPFTNWLDNIEARKKLAAEPLFSEANGLVKEFDFKAAKLGRNKAVQTTGGKDGVELTGDDAIAVGAGKFKRSQPFSITARIRIPKSDDGNPIARNIIFHCSKAWTDSASRGYQLLIEDGKLSASLIHFWPGDAINVRTTEIAPTEKWLHVTMIYDGSSSAAGLKIFIDGQPQPVEIVHDNLRKTILGSGTKQLIIGERFRDRGFKNGGVADLKVFNRQLAEIETAQLQDETSLTAALQTPAAEISAAQRTQLQDYFVATQSPPFAQQLKTVQERRAALNAFIDKQKSIMVMQEQPTPRPAFLLDRGSYDSPSKPVTAQTPAILPPMKINGDRPANRLDLAQWLVDEKNPLTARVAVNHYWQMMFGAGLVRTAEDFGSQGSPPTHPELLDWLALDFQADWDIKRCLKQMVMSATYQQSTAASAELRTRDPENELLAHASSFRLPAEMLRDNVLYQSGLLVEKIGGPPVKPYEVAVAFSPSKPDQGDGLYRRSLYTYWKRTGPAPVMLTFDAATRDVCQVKRERTSSPLQALVQLNSPQFIEAARILSEKIMMQVTNTATDEEAKTDDVNIEDTKTEELRAENAKTDKTAEDEIETIASTLFRSLTSRHPSPRELKVLINLYQQQLSIYQKNETAVTQLLSVGDTKSKTDQLAELAAWTTVTSTLMNFDECVVRR